MPSRSSIAASVSAARADENDRYIIPNLRNACRILKHLGGRSDGMKVADLGRELGVPVTTTLRIMATLHREGFVRKSGSHYELGPVLIQLGGASLAGTEIRDAAAPILAGLTGDTAETSHLAIPCEDRSLIVAVQDSPHPLRAASRPGFLGELHCTATGKTLLAFLHSGRLEEFYAKTRPTKRTAHTLTALAEIRREIELVRKRGYSLDDEEFNLGVRCLAAPVFDATGKLAGAIGITAATVRFTKDRVPEIAAKVRARAAELSQVLGYTQPTR